MERKIDIPEKVTVEIKERKVIVKGPKGEIEKEFDDPRYNKAVVFSMVDNAVIVRTVSDKRKFKAFMGTISRHVKNMILGVTIGFNYMMKITYSHFPISIDVKGNEAQIKNFIGEKSARVAEILGKTEIKIQKDQVNVIGIDIEDVGQTAANIEQACRIPRKDRRVFQDGIYISSKTLQTGEKIRKQ